MGEFVTWSTKINLSNDFKHAVYFYNKLTFSPPDTITHYLVWCKENTVGRYSLVGMNMVFENEEDAMAFKLIID